MKLNDFSKPLTEAMGVVESENQYQFDVEGAPRWKKLSDAYKARKRRIFGFTNKLVATGALFASLVKRWAAGAIAVVTPDEMRRGTSLTVGTKRRWNLGLIHQLGAPRASIPARPMMRLRRRAQAAIVGIFHRWLTELGEGVQP